MESIVWYNLLQLNGFRLYSKKKTMVFSQQLWIHKTTFQALLLNLRGRFQLKSEVSWKRELVSAGTPEYLKHKAPGRALQNDRGPFCLFFI